MNVRGKIYGAGYVLKLKLLRVQIWTGSSLNWVSGYGSTRAMVALPPEKKIQEMSCWGARYFLSRADRISGKILNFSTINSFLLLGLDPDPDSPKHGSWSGLKIIWIYNTVPSTEKHEARKKTDAYRRPFWQWEHCSADRSWALILHPVHSPDWRTHDSTCKIYGQRT